MLNALSGVRSVFWRDTHEWIVAVLRDAAAPLRLAELRRACRMRTLTLVVTLREHDQARRVIEREILSAIGLDGGGDGEWPHTLRRQASWSPARNASRGAAEANARAPTRPGQVRFNRIWLIPIPHRVVVRDINRRGPTVTRRAKDPGAMSPKKRLAELGSIFATGLRRMQISREKALADGGDAERPWLSVNTPESRDDKEVA